MPSPKSGISTRDTVTGLETFGRVGTSNHTRDRGMQSRGSRRRDCGERGPDRGGLHPPVLRTCGCVTGLAPRSRRMVPRVLPTKEYISGLSSTGLDDVFVTAVVNVRNALDRRLERAMCREEVRSGLHTHTRTQVGSHWLTQLRCLTAVSAGARYTSPAPAACRPARPGASLPPCGS